MLPINKHIKSVASMNYTISDIHCS